MVVIKVPARRGHRPVATPVRSSGNQPRSVARAPSAAPRTESSAESSLAEPTLSILIPTIPGREAKLAKLLNALFFQIESCKDVQVMALMDNRSVSIGCKRNSMIAAATGRYVAFVDDDDMVSDDYVESILHAIKTEDPDLVCFVVTVLGHGHPKPCHYHPSFTNQNLPDGYRRKPNHLMVWRRRLIQDVPFPDLKIGEDTEWAEAMSREETPRTSVIEKSLYVYQFDPADNSATP